ncbi:hypothetical protein [Verminephrobacter aporrectodeae]|nr:hypothetical protein [Verminephrobacter aporrectodeae]
MQLLPFLAPDRAVSPDSRSRLAGLAPRPDPVQAAPGRIATLFMLERGR